MKLLLALILLSSFAVFANAEKKTEVKSEETPKVDTEKTLEKKSENKDEKKADKKAAHKEAYKKAKEACLAENKELKGKDLKECIVNKQKEAK